MFCNIYIIFVPLINLILLVMQITIDVVKDGSLKKFYVDCECANGYEVFYDEKDVIDFVKFWL